MAAADIKREVRKWRKLVWDFFDPSLGAAGEAFIADGSGGGAYGPVSAGGGLPDGYLSGLITAPNAAQPLDDLDIDVGVAKDSTNAQDIDLTSLLTKQIDANWAAGTNAGGFPSGLTLSNNTWYHVFVIYDSGNDLVDAGFDTSITATNLLADATGYTFYRRIGSVLTDGSSDIVPFRQDGNVFTWLTPVVDHNQVTPTATRTLYTLSVPPDVKVRPRGTARFLDSDPSAFAVALTDPDTTDFAPVANTVYSVQQNGAVASQGEEISLEAIHTNTSSQIGVRADFANFLFDIATYGWIDPRAGFTTGGGGAGAATPGGADTQVQYNDSGAFAGDPAFTFDDVLQTWTFGDGTAISNIDLNTLNNGNFEIEFQEAGSVRARLAWYASVAGNTDVARFGSFVPASGPTNSICEFVADNLVQLTLNEQGAALLNGLQMRNRASAAFGDVVSRGQLFINSSNNLIYRDASGTETDLSGGAGGAFTIDANDNIFGGVNAGAALTTGVHNFLAGENAGLVITGGDDNIGIGENVFSGMGANVNNNIGIGESVLDKATGLNGNNVVIGRTAGRSITAGENNVCLGTNALGNPTPNMTADDNVFIGFAAANSASVTNPQENVGIGANVFAGLTSGDRNVVIGNDGAVALTAGADNTMIGEGVGAQITAGANNILIGKDAGPTTDQSNQLFIDITQNNTPFIHGNFSTNVFTVHPDSTTAALQVDANATAGNTRLLLYDVDNGTLERVSVGAADSGGTGFKVLRIPN